MSNFIITITYLIIGILLRRVPKFPKESATTLNLFVIYVSLPALVLLKIPEMTFSSRALVPVFMPWCMLLVSALLVLTAARIFKWNREVTGCLMLMIPLGNTSFLGIPMVQAFFGNSGIPYAVLYDQLGSFIALATYGSVILAIYGKDEARQSIRDIIVKIVTFPPLIALVIATLSKNLTYPEIITHILKALSSTLVPVVMIAVGFQLYLRLEPKVLTPLATGLFIKLIIAPVVALLLCVMAGLRNEAAQVSIFEAGMPPMVSAGALALIANLSPRLTAALVGAGIIVCFATLPLIYKIMFLWL